MCNVLKFMIEPGEYGRQVVESLKDLGFEEIDRDKDIFGDWVTFGRVQAEEAILLTRKAILALANEQERFASERLAKAAHHKVLHLPGEELDLLPGEE